jgi:hypothetical protein
MRTPYRSAAMAALALPTGRGAGMHGFRAVVKPQEAARRAASQWALRLTDPCDAERPRWGGGGPGWLQGTVQVGVRSNISTI